MIRERKSALGVLLRLLLLLLLQCGAGGAALLRGSARGKAALPRGPARVQEAGGAALLRDSAGGKAALPRGPARVQEALPRGRARARSAAAGALPTRSRANLKCPTGSAWYGIGMDGQSPGVYCVGGDLRECMEEGQSDPPLREACANGCQQHPTKPGDLDDVCREEGSSNLKCPTGSAWYGIGMDGQSPGVYCVGGDLRECMEEGQSDPPLREACANGCQQHPTKPGDLDDVCREEGSTPVPTPAPTPAPTPVPYVPRCPSSRAWHGSGTYCVGSNMAKCRTAGEEPVEVVTNCLAGCSVGLNACWEDAPAEYKNRNRKQS